MISFNLPDPTDQERVRRGPHKYQAEGGMHGRYIPTVEGVPVTQKGVQGVYRHEEYPKIMDKTPFPQLKDFAGKQDAEILLEHARKAWDQRQMASIVKSETEEKTWLADHAHDPVLTPGAYPKTMDHTPAPRAIDCTGVDDYRNKRQAWRDQITASIVHDEVEEQLWLEEHPLETRSKLESVTVKPAPKRRGRKPKAESVAVA